MEDFITGTNPDNQSTSNQTEYANQAEFSNPIAHVDPLGYDNYPSYPNQEDHGGLVGHGEVDQRKFTLKLSVSVDKTGSVALIFAASIIVLVSAARACAGKKVCEYGDASINYAIAVGVVSMIISGGYILATKYRSSFATSFAPYVSIFLLIWWGFGATITTFNEPFWNVGNGYFASWLGFTMSGSFASQTVEKLSSRTTGIQALSLDRAVVFFVLMASAIEIVAAAVLCNNNNDCNNDNAFAVACGVLSACVCLIYLLARGALPLNMAAGFLGIWWMISTGVLTFDEGDTFGFVGNGYFAIWCCFLASFYLCYHVFLGGMS